MRKSIFIAAALLATGAAHADFIPIVKSGQNVATVTVNNRSLSYSEPRGNGPLGGLIIDAAYTPYQIQSTLNGIIAPQVNSYSGVTFLSGELKGYPTLTMRPDASGVVFVNMSGLSYKIRARYAAKLGGIIKLDCTNTTAVDNISITAQYGTSNGLIPSDKVGVTGTPSSSTDCDSNLTWVMPLLSNYLVNKLEGYADARLVSGIQSGMSSVTQKMFFQRDANWQVGLNRLIPADKVIVFADGSTFAIGQYVQNNLSYLISNGQITMKLGGGVNLSPVVGVNEPPRNLAGDALTITVSVPGLTFTANLREEVNVVWQWKCSVQNPALNCADPR
ncbi:hypothetical protein GCM10027277_16500 [Pseudoduganella ginsengisoli]|uniref:Uncharacterized protein n=1 Tax=Pseudoduganella ginsengisoli TaxID=1462440 RepID=A0A6L6PVP5_9BURK|nr:hypothetical protein [Pseudoduganella ginsengisoli]MTW01088.1 hypothetical protein [Pseudoduganella ginsengisoli]